MNSEKFQKIIQKERFVLSVLEAKAHNKKNDLYKYFSYRDKVGNKIEFDAFAPKGFENLFGPTVFEIKSGQVNPIRYLEILEKKIATFHKSEIEIQNLVLILIEKETTNIKFSETIDNINIKLIGKEIIEQWEKEYKDEYLLYLSPVEEVINEEHLSISKVNNNKFIKNLSDSYKRNNLVFVLGAGVSFDYMSKSWNELIQDFENDLWNKYFHKKAKLMDDIKEIVGDNQVISIQLWKDIFLRSNNERYYKIILESLYPKGHIYPMIKKDTTLSEIAKLLSTKNEKNINQIITYNYDNHLENELSNYGVNYESIYYPRQVTNSSLSVYHVHGFMPHNYNSLSKSDKEKCNESIVLSEHDYNNLYNNHLLWNVSVQLSIAREKTCLFIGHGFKDPNLLRLFKIMSDENSKICHYAIIKKEKQYSDSAYMLFAKRLASVGISVIWIDDFDEIPRIIRSL